MDEALMQQNADLAQLQTIYANSMIVSGLMSLLFLASFWRIFSKAGQPGWACLIPFYNLMVMSKIGGRSPVFAFTLLIPLVNLVTGIMIAHGISKAFGKGALFTIGQIFVPFVFLPLLAFGDSKYVGVSGTPGAQGHVGAGAPPFRKAA